MKTRKGFKCESCDTKEDMTHDEAMEHLGHDYKESKPTPVPWFTDPSFDHESISAGPHGFLVADCSRTGGNHAEYKANAAFIVRAVNNFDLMLNTLHHLLNKPELLTDKFYRDQITKLLAMAEGKV